MIDELVRRIEKLGIIDHSSLDQTVVVLGEFLRMEREPREIALCEESRLEELRDKFLELVDQRLSPLLQEFKMDSVSTRVLAEQVEAKIFRKLMAPLKSQHKPLPELRVPLEDALGSLIYEIRFILLNRVVNHPDCKYHDPHRVYVLLYPEVEEDIKNTGKLYNILNEFYQNLTDFLSFESLPESFVPKSMRSKHVVFSRELNKNWTIWEYIREIFQSGKLIQPETWTVIGNELQSIIKHSEKAINDFGGMMRLSDRLDFEQRIQEFHRFSFTLAQCHIQCLNHFKKQNFELITPVELHKMVELTLQLDQTVSELQDFLRVWMRHLEARTCLHYTAVLQTIESDNMS